jgi:biotin carboxyl carrier protein
VEYEFEISGRTRHVVVRRTGDRFVVAVDGREQLVDARRVDAETLSLLIEEVRLKADTAYHEGGKGGTDRTGEAAAIAEGTERFRSFEIMVTPDRSGALSVRVGATTVQVVPINGRSSRRLADAAAHGAGRPQRLAAPMPGKVVRVLAAKGDRVKARQPIMVIEAMKMENELRAISDGVVAEILVGEGQLVEAGMQVALLEAVEDR